MKRALLAPGLVAAVLTCASGPAAAAQADSGGEVIGYTTHSVINHFYTLMSFSAAAADLVADGHTLVPIDDLSSGALAGIDRLVVGLVHAFIAPTPQQVDAIEAFVLGGGKLVFLGDNNTNFYFSNAAVGGRFGIQYPFGDPPETVLTDVAPHPITQGPYGAVNVLDGSANLPGFFGSMMNPGPGGVPLVSFPGGASAVVVIEPGQHAPGSGLIVAFSEVSTWHDTYFQGDNRALWRNTFAYNPVPPSSTYCTAGTSASGCQALLSFAGTPSATAPSGFDLSAATVEAAKEGLFFFGTNGRQANPWGNGTSFLCVAPPVKRTGVMQGVGAPGTCTGSFVRDLNAHWCPTCPKPAQNPGAGALVQAQLWYRDPLSTDNQTTAFSDAVEFFVQPQ